MRLLHVAAHPETWGLNSRTDITNPQATIPNDAKVLPRNRATTVAAREVVGEMVAVEGTMPMEGVTKAMGLTMIQGVVTTLMVGVVPIMMGEILGTDPSQRHALPRSIHVTW